nr:hypothetical protein [Tanacetum cinerariifolium]
MKDKVMPNNGQVKLKKTEVEDHHRISSISSKIKTKKPNVAPISTRKPKSQAKKSVAPPRKKTVASETTTHKSKSYYRMLHEKTSNEWKWWIERQCPSEPFVVKQDPDKNSSQIPPQINHPCCYGCGDSLEYIFCHKCTCELCGRDAHYGYNCPPKVLIVPDLEPFNNQTVDELPQTLPSFDPTCYSEDENSFTYDSTSNLVHVSPKDFNPPLQPLINSYEFCRNDAYYGHDCSFQVPLTYDPEPCYNQDFNFP